MMACRRRQGRLRSRSRLEVQVPRLLSAPWGGTPIQRAAYVAVIRHLNGRYCEAGRITKEDIQEAEQMGRAAAQVVPVRPRL